MVNVFGDSIASGSGNLQVVKKVSVTVGKFKDYIDEIQQSYELGFTHYRLYKNVDGVCYPHSRLWWEDICIGRCCHNGGWQSTS